MKKAKYWVAAILVLAGLSLSLVSEILVATAVHTPATSIIANTGDQSEPDSVGPGYWD